MRRNNKHDVDIQLVEPSDYSGIPNSESSNRELASKERQITVNVKGSKLFSVVVPKTVFNPYLTASTSLFIDMIMKGEIETKDQRVIDLGCGSGVIGFTARIKGAKSILYTDINPNINKIESHRLFRPGTDRVEVQNLCEGEDENTSDMVIFGVPGTLVDSEPDKKSIDVALFRPPNFIHRLVENVAKVLVPSGRFIFWYRIDRGQVINFVEFMMLLSRYFCKKTLKCLAEYQHDYECATVIYSIDRKSN